MDAKAYLESKGYEFPDKDFWMEDYVTEHKFKDLVSLMEGYHEQKIKGDTKSQSDGFCYSWIALRNPICKEQCERCKQGGDLRGGPKIVNKLPL